MSELLEEALAEFRAWDHERKKEFCTGGRTPKLRRAMRLRPLPKKRAEVEPARELNVERPLQACVSCGKGYQPRKKDPPRECSRCRRDRRVARNLKLDRKCVRCDRQLKGEFGRVCKTCYGQDRRASLRANPAMQAKETANNERRRQTNLVLHPERVRAAEHARYLRYKTKCYPQIRERARQRYAAQRLARILKRSGRARITAKSIPHLNQTER